MIVYKMTNKINGISYVGATKRRIDIRLRDHLSAAKQGRTSLIAQAIRQFGIAAFAIEILHTVDSGSYDDLMQAEIQAIKEHGTLEPHGYNRTSGGLGTPDRRALESTKLKIGAKSKGRIQSEETRQKRSLKMKGCSSSNKGRKTGKPAWNRGLKHSKETCKKLSESRVGGKNPQASPIIFRGVEYPSLMDAVRSTGFSLMQVRDRLKKGDNASYVTEN